MTKKNQITAETINEWYHGNQAGKHAFPKNFLFDSISYFVTKNNIYEDNFLEILKNVDVRDIKDKVFEKMDFSSFPQFLRDKSLNPNQFRILIEKSIPEGRMPQTLDGLDLKDVQFDKLALSISGITFKNCNMEGADLSVNNCSFEGNTNLKGANFGNRKLENVSFGGEVDLSDANFRQTSFVNARFHPNTKLPKVENFEGCEMDYNTRANNEFLSKHLDAEMLEFLGIDGERKEHSIDVKLRDKLKEKEQEETSSKSEKIKVSKAHKLEKSKDLEIDHESKEHHSIRSKLKERFRPKEQEEISSKAEKTKDIGKNSQSKKPDFIEEILKEKKPKEKTSKAEAVKASRGETDDKKPGITKKSSEGRRDF